jgi:hypothetical protein
MIETLAVFAGLCIALYLCFSLLDAITGRLQPLQDSRLTAADLVSGVVQSPISTGGYHTPIDSCVMEAGLCPETAKAIGSLGEGIQSALEVAGESLGNAIGGF